MGTRPGPRRLFRRRSPTLGESLGRHIDEAGGSAVGRALVVCTRVGDADFVPPGYRLADCRECGRPCWLNPAIDDELRDRGVEPLVACMKCAAGQ